MCFPGDACLKQIKLAKQKAGDIIQFGYEYVFKYWLTLFSLEIHYPWGIFIYEGP
jgi:hypothetical protein